VGESLSAAFAVLTFLIMKTFSRLLKGPGTPGEQQAAASELLPSMLAQSKLRYWSPSMPFSLQGERLLIGVVTWSVYDLKLLDCLQEMFSHAGRTTVIDIFDADGCHTQDDFADYIPGIGRVQQTPAVGIWRDGEIVLSAWGFAGRQLLKEIGLVPHSFERDVEQGS
jgi:hypothetical protein